MFSSNASQVSNDVKYIEDVCSVYLRTGTGSSQTVTTGIKENTGALVISKSRSAATDWAWYDTFRGATYDLVSNSPAAQTTQSQGLTSFNADGHTWGTLAKVNTNGATYVDTVLKPTPKFFDVVTYTGNGSAGRTVSHNLGSAPGFMVVKKTSASGDNWMAWHRSISGSYILLNTTGASVPSQQYVFGNDVIAIDPTSTVFTLASDGSVNANGATYVAYLFAHNAGGFGTSGTDNVISCGSYVGNGSASGPVINLGYEPQWVLAKGATDVSSWRIGDNMRGLVVGGDDSILIPNSSAAETTSTWMTPTATGFQIDGTSSAVNTSGSTYIYIAIRRGPMKVPTDGTSVFKPLGTSPASTTSGVGFPADMSLAKYAVSSQDWLNSSRLTNKILYTNSTGAEDSIFGPAGPQPFDTQDGFKLTSISTTDYAFWAFKRAPSFFDEVCYTGTGVDGATFSHNLTVAPELMIVKLRSAATDNWFVYSAALGATKALYLNTTNAAVTSAGFWNDTAPTSSVFSTYSAFTNQSGQTYVAYLFATVAGVSKVGSYTGTGTTLQVNCGFTAGSRFVLIKRTDSTGSWYVWDVARGISSGNDPYLLLNSTAAEVTNTDYIDAYSAGFEISSTAPAEINASGGTFIYLSIA